MDVCLLNDIEHRITDQLICLNKSNTVENGFYQNEKNVLLTYPDPNFFSVLYFSITFPELDNFPNNKTR